MKKICFLVGYYPINKGGAEYQAYLISQYLKNKFEIFYISIGQDEELSYAENGMKIYNLMNPKFLGIPNSFFMLKKKIFSILKTENPDFIYQRVLFSATGIAAAYCKSTRCKLIWNIAHVNDVQIQHIKFSRRMLTQIIERFWSRYGITHANYIIAQAAYQAKLLKKNFGRNVNLILRNLHRTETEKIIKENPVKVVWISNYKKFKRLELYLELVKSLSYLNNVKFILAGRLPSNELLKEIEQITLHINNFQVLGEISNDNVNTLLREAHVLVNTSESEGFPNSFIQAWLREVPVVSLSVDPDDIIKTEGIGFHSGTLENLVRDVKILSEDESLRMNMGKKARLFAEKEFDILTNVEKIKKLLA